MISGIGGMILILGSIFTYRGEVFKAVFTYMFADFIWIYLGLLAGNTTGVIFIALGAVFGVLAFLKMYRGEYKKTITRKNPEVRNATIKLLERCKEKFHSDSNEYKLAEQGIKNQNLPIDKISRWLGYLQGVLIERGITDVETERDFSRLYFMNAYKIEDPEFYKRVMNDKTKNK